MPPQVFDELPDAPDSPARARAWARQRIDAWRAASQEPTRASALAALADDLGTVTTELVTNAMLHGAPPIGITLTLSEEALRVEVHDRSRILPRRGRSDTTMMTGRGLTLVEALSRDWGIALDDEGKGVWCELAVVSGTVPVGVTQWNRRIDSGSGHGGQRDADPADASEELEPSEDERLVTVVVGEVPTRLLVAAKAHVDNVLRELTLAAAGAESGRTAAVPSGLAEAIRDVATGFSYGREAVKRQAVAAVASGRERVTLALSVPLRAAADGARYLTALESIDGFARAARLLTVETPPDQRAFRTWYVRSVIDQVRAIADGEPIAEPPTFEDFLLSEVAATAAARRASERAARLHQVTAALTVAITTDDVARVVLDAALASVGATRGAVLLVGPDGGLRCVRSVGHTPEQIRWLVQTERAPASLPIHRAVRTSVPVWLEGPEERRAGFPDLRGVEPGAGALGVLPLAAAGRVIGALRLSFDTPRLFDADDREFLTSLAAQTAQTLERARLHERQLQLTDRLTRLHALTSDLGRIRDVDGVCETTLRHAAEELGAEISTVCLVSADGRSLRLAGTVGSVDVVDQLWRQFPVDANLPASEVVRTCSAVIVSSLDERMRRYPDLGDAPPRHDHSLVCLPLVVHGRPLGVLTLTFAGPSRESAIERTELTFLAAVADSCAQALERARTQDSASADRPKPHDEQI